MSSNHRDALEPATISHVGELPVLSSTPLYLTGHAGVNGSTKRTSCSFCGVGDSAVLSVHVTEVAKRPPDGKGVLQVEGSQGVVEYAASLLNGCEFTVQSEGVLTGPIISGDFVIADESFPVVARRAPGDAADSGQQHFRLNAPKLVRQTTKLKGTLPTPGCLKLRVSMGLQPPVFPIHVQPSIPDGQTGHRIGISYEDGIRRLADLLLEHRPAHGRTLIYACGQIDYFTIFALQEVFRLLGVRNLAGNAEHCLNAGAVHNEILTGQEGPFLTIEQAIHGPNRFFLLNGWNGLIAHPPVFGQLLKYSNFDGYMIEVAETESVRAFVKKAGVERLLLIRSGSDPQLALAVAHEILTQHPQAVEQRFIDQFSDAASWDECQTLALDDRFAVEAVSKRIAPTPDLRERLVVGIRDIAERLARPETVPINIPSIGLSQTKGVVAHCLWGNLLGMLGKYGLNADGTPAGGTLRIPGQVNAQTEVQGLSRNFFMGRIRMTDEGVADAARRMGLPIAAYSTAVKDTPRTALDYSDQTDLPELFVCFGTQFESNMPGRKRWIEKLTSPNTTLVVIDPIPDPFALRHASLVLPSPPHAAVSKLYQNGEWRLTLSQPQRAAPPETRSDAAIVYDAMAEISQRLRGSEELRTAHPDLAQHVEYLRERFEAPDTGGGLERIEGEVSRRQLWERIQNYLTGPAESLGPLYCRPEHADGRLVTWDELIEQGEVMYGGVGSTRYRLDYDEPGHVPFRDIWRRPGRFRFFLPTEDDLRLPDGIVLVSGRSTLSDDNKRVRFAISTFNSGKATSGVGMPDENPLHISRELADEHGISDGDLVRVTGRDSGASIVLPACVTDRVRGLTVYCSFHKTKAEIESGRYLNDLTSHLGRCPYTAQSNLKQTIVTLERLS